MLVAEKTSNTSENRLRRELAHLRAENKFLRESKPMSQRYSKIVATAQADAIELIDSRWMSERTSKFYAFHSLGMSERRWFWAVALLRYCGVVSMGGRRGELDFSVNLRADALGKLNNAATELINDPGGYKRLKRLLPNSRRGN